MCLIYRIVSILFVFVNLFTGLTKATLPLLIVHYCLAKILLCEVGPEFWSEVQLTISNLPQEEVADALVAGSSYQQVGVGHVRSGKSACKNLVVNIVGIQFAANRSLRQLAGGLTISHLAE